MNLELTPNALLVLEKRLLSRDERGNLCETPEGMFRRVANSIASADIEYGATREEVELTEASFFDAMTRLEFLPNSPTLMNAGRDLGQLSACFVLPVDDSIPAIFDAVKWAAQIQMTGGGTGFAFSRLRPAGDPVATTKGVASGPVSFIDVLTRRRTRSSRAVL